MRARWSPTTPESGAKHQTINDLEHLAAAKLLRRGRIDMVRPQTAEPVVRVRDLGCYDTAFGIDTDTTADTPAPVDGEIS